MYKALGTPTKVDTVNNEFGTERTLHYAEDFFQTNDSNDFFAFALKSSKYLLCNGAIKVGDNISKLNDLTKRNCKIERRDVNTMFLFVGKHTDTPVVITHNSKDVIIGIYFEYE